MFNQDIIAFFKSMFRRLSKKEVIYLRIFTNKIEIRNLDKQFTITKNSFENFSNERLLVASFSILEKFIRDTLDEFYENKNRLFKKPLIVLIQAMEKVEGGISEVERMVFNDLAEQIGGSEVYIYDTFELLNDSEVLKVVNR